MKRRLLRPALWPALAVAVACLLALLEGGVALAHPQIVAIEPIPDSQLSTAPSVVAITFNEAIEGLSTLALYTAQGALVRDGGGRDPSNPARLTLALPPLEPGRYTAVYTVAGSDGHVVRGNFAFSVIGPTSAAAAPAAATAVAGEATPVAPVAPSPSTSAKPRAPIAQSLVRWVLLLGATGWVGGWAYWVWVAFPALGGAVAPPAAVGRWRVWSGVLLALLLVGAPLLLALYVAEITGAVTLPALRSGVGTRQGMLLLTRLGLAVGLLALTLTTRDGATIARRGPLALLLGAALLLVMALGGHAGAAAQPLIPVALIWLHLAATSVWVGGLLLFALTLRPLLRSRPADGRAVLLGDLVARFSRLAIVSVAVLTVSGLARALGELYRWSDLWTSAYGLTLSIKLLLFGGMLALGAYHLLIAGPGIRGEGRQPAGSNEGLWAGRLSRSLRAEAGLALLALAAAGALTSLAPPAAATDAQAVSAVPPRTILAPTVPPGPTATPVPSRPFEATKPAGDLMVRLAVAPASLGANHFQVTVTDAAGKPVETQRVRLTFKMEEMDMGLQTLEAAPAGASTYAVSGNPLSMVGHWEVTVLVRRAGLNDVTAGFIVPVGQ